MLRTNRALSPIAASLAVALASAWMLIPASAASAQPKRLRDIERSCEAVVIIADASTGRIVAGVRLAAARERRYFPGSLFKLAIAVAALRSGHVDRSTTYKCVGKDTIGGVERRCWNHAGHATIGFSDAVAQSCNLYFRHLAQSLSMQEIAQAARGIGMAPPDISEPAGLGFLNDETLLGSAYTVSAEQMLACALSLASRGRLAPGRTDLFTATYRPLYDGLRMCVRNGTGKGATLSVCAVGGKTGTAEVPGQPGHTVGWFIGFAPFDHPKYAVVVMYPRARGFEAATIAGRALGAML